MLPVETRVLSLLTGRKRTFEELLELTWGITPKELQEVLENLGKQDRVRVAAGHYGLMGSSYPGEGDGDGRAIDARALNAAAKRTEAFLEKLPIPHPHDFDWRFSVAGIRSFVSHIARYHDKSDAICVVAAPTVYAFLRCLDHFGDIALVERSEETVDTIRQFFHDSHNVSSHDLQYPWPPRFIGEFRGIIMDPPWYQDYYELFLLRSTEILSEGGFIHTALFPPFAKTHSLAERASIIAFAQNRGLYLVELANGLLEYESPPFEKTSFRADGHVSGRCWRHGDLGSFWLGQKYAGQHVYRVESGLWKDFRIGRSKLKLRLDESPAYEAPAVETVEQNTPFLRDISRKYSKRDEIGLWTSCQQAYKVVGSQVVHIMLQSVLDGQNRDTCFRSIASQFEVPLERVSADCGKCYDDLRNIVEVEEKRQGDYEDTAGTMRELSDEGTAGNMQELS